MDEKQECLEAANRWDTLATEAEKMAAWERDRNIDLSLPRLSVGDCCARLFRKCANSLRLEAETGQPHCTCHGVPSDSCPLKQPKTGR
jgi:hypothetical protein